MNFQPFGYRIRITTKLPLEQCKAEVLRRLVSAGGRAADRRPRGVFFGNHLMLWMSAYDLINGISEPKLLCKFEPSVAGTIISGRAIPGISVSVSLVLWTLCSIGIAAYLAFTPPPYVVESLFVYNLVKVVLVAAIWLFIAGIAWFQHVTRYDGRPMETWLIRVLHGEKLIVP